MSDDINTQALMEKINRLELELAKKKQWRGFSVWIREQGTQRGLLLLVPIILVNFAGLDKDTALEITTGILALYGAHNVVTEG